ncbi:YgiW/YdeI family stress tolerance OB fold protein [Citrobacter sp. wls711]|uniref:YgiW/YdeI family stress tolerance OB fold protein n=1 Tax=Citrobacter sp. wls711 TaxID=2576425 RepID=UPI0010CA8904|nr:YgiW/YdeI family stress tolerance OB fold protein [Citrobacter sp. wls711]TKU58874.1 YgiW/YdeI family stress tolerance OB fold protein [Citrobacter sp. wls711]
MKKLAAMVAVMALCSAPVLAAQQGGFSGPTATQSQAGGFVGPNGSSTTVESAKSLRDDTWVTLRGNIVERISDDLYLFKDASGTVNVDIDHKRWNGLTVTPQDVVEIQGEVDKDWNSVEIDVKQITKVTRSRPFSL